MIPETINKNTTINLSLSELIKWMLQFIVLVGTAVALYYNLTNEFNLVKTDISRLNKEFEEMKTEFRIHLRNEK